MRKPALLAFSLGVAALALALGGTSRAEPKPPSPGRRCPAEMAAVQSYCIDRWEITTVDRASGEPLSPYYPPDAEQIADIHSYWNVQRQSYGSKAARELSLPELPEWQREHRFIPKAVSRSGVVPQGYLSYYAARRSCENAGKRLCTKDEWLTACEGQHATKYPYGSDYRAGRCNVYRALHPAAVLHDSASLGHRDPRLNLIDEALVGPLLKLTGATPDCKSEWGDAKIFDMVGNLDEWVEADPPEFVGGFYARMTTSGCEAKVSSHAAVYYDYSTGTRCCADPK